jgi:hypothetical protein
MIYQFIGINSKTPDYKAHIKPHTKILFSDLSNYDLVGLDLSGCSFFGCKLDKVDLRQAKLYNCMFQYCILSDDQSPPLFDKETELNVEIEHCNFLVTTEGFQQVKSEKYNEVNLALKMLQNIDAVNGVELMDKVLSFQTYDTFKVFAYAHLFYSGNTFIEAAMFAQYQKVVLDQKWLTILGDNGLALYELFLSQLTDTYVAQDIQRFYEEHWLKSNVQQQLKILQNLFNRICSPVKADQLLGFKAIRSFCQFDNTAQTSLLNKACLLEHMASNHQTIRKNALYVIANLLPDINGEGDDKLKQQCQQQLAKLLELKNLDVDIITDLLLFIEKNHFYDWGKQNPVKNLINHSYEEISEKAKHMIFRLLEEEEEIIEFIKDYNICRHFKLEIVKDELENRALEYSSYVVADNKLDKLLSNQENKQNLLLGLKLLSFTTPPQYLKLLKNYITHPVKIIRLTALQALSYYNNQLLNNFPINLEELDSLLMSEDFHQVADGVALLGLLDKGIAVKKINKLKNHHSYSVQNTCLNTLMLIANEPESYYSFLSDNHPEKIRLKALDLLIDTDFDLQKILYLMNDSNSTMASRVSSLKLESDQNN